MDEKTQEQVIVARSKLWTPELDKLLRRWKKQIGNRQKGHSDLSRTYNLRHYLFGVPTIILSAIISSGIFATFENCSTCDNQYQAKCIITVIIRIIIGLLQIIVVALSAFNTFMDYSDASADHKMAADKYGSLYRDLDSLLLIPGPLRGDPVTVLNEIRRRYDDMVIDAPNLPSKYNIDLTYDVSNTVVAKPPKPDSIKIDVMTPILSDDLPLEDNVSPNEDEKSPYIDVSSGPQIAIGRSLNRSIITTSTNSPNSLSITHSVKSEDQHTFLEKINEDLEAQNKYDTSDEEHDVCIGFDLDTQTSNDPEVTKKVFFIRIKY